MKELEKLNLIQRSILLASILGDGEITKIYRIPEEKTIVIENIMEYNKKGIVNGKLKVSPNCYT
ncbi:hypothetical protein ACFFIX_12230 [Metabacillus herbersteinensis]|uniref:Uncharacterized protein n=1 Tax=Metabacillus herbersteinensis TaxID=283816 RepID=A0ABV6GFG9_9BACI